MIGKCKNGFTLIELLIVIGTMLVLLSLSSVYFRTFQKHSDLDNATEKIINILRLAQNKTIASEGASQYGVYFEKTVSPHRYILFKGSSYALRDISSDQTYKLPQAIEIYEINLQGGNEIIFNRIDGQALQPGNVNIRLTNEPTQAKSVYIESSGLIGVSRPSLFTDERLKDSRHVHFDLGWNIQNATALKFYFPAIPHTETVEMVAYFNADKTDFDWQGVFVVGGVEQIFKIHTHLLDAFSNTSLCIHRDRNNGKTNQEVTISIVEGGQDKEIAHYLADESDSVSVGAFGGTIEAQ